MERKRGERERLYYVLIGNGEKVNWVSWNGYFMLDGINGRCDISMAKNFRE